MNKFKWYDWLLGIIALSLLISAWIIYPTAGIMASVSLFATILIWTMLPDVVKGICAAFRLLSDSLISLGILMIFGGTSLGGIIGASLVAIAFSLIIKYEQYKQEIFCFTDLWKKYRGNKKVKFIIN